MKNKILLSTILVVFTICGCNIGQEKDLEYSLPEYIESSGGTNFAFYDIGEDYLTGQDRHSWWKPGVLKHTIGAFDKQQDGVVENTLRQMYDNGQRKIALILWHINIAEQFEHHGSKWEGDIPSGYEDTYGHIVNSALGKLSSQHEENLKELLGLICDTGFETITIRFAPQGVNNPMDWTDWQEEFYQENISFLLSVKDIADKVVGDKSELIYDLGLELGGMEAGLSLDYIARLWDDYTGMFPVDNTVGFSFAVERGRITRMLEIYKKSGIYPPVYALDIYLDGYTILSYSIEELRKGGIEEPKIIIMETFYNDTQVLEEFQRAAKEHNVSILYIMQWQVDRDRLFWYNDDGSRSMRHFSISSPIEYDNYLITE